MKIIEKLDQKIISEYNTQNEQEQKEKMQFFKDKLKQEDSMVISESPETIVYFNGEYHLYECHAINYQKILFETYQMIQDKLTVAQCRLTSVETTLRMLVPMEISLDHLFQQCRHSAMTIDIVLFYEKAIEILSTLRSCLDSIRIENPEGVMEIPESIVSGDVSIGKLYENIKEILASFKEFYSMTLHICNMLEEYMEMTEKYYIFDSDRMDEICILYEKVKDVIM